ncbi:extracellular solute-binding protein [Cohnella fermenti]|uniref:Extracellular solute-binding protein n=1 Tax=Cohnella fermenti TaxID=2565925 RepID=A0A4S4BTR7_9BACL|nr:extracellular solute-binding protein [Cohnella fermenti]THF76264.1 extracellular solute-binding protein [Cohnella fermenti]
MVSKFGRAARWTAPLAGVVLLAGCGLLDRGDPLAANAKADAGADAVSIYSFDRQDYGSRPDRVLEAIEAATNTRISLQTGAWEDTQLDILIATGGYPDVLTIVDNEKTGRFNKWVKEGKIIPFTDELTEGLPHLRKLLDEPRYQELRVNGQFYGIPLQDELPQGSVGQHVLILRQDWLDRLGLPLPETLEELRRTLIAFRDEDPDGNGVQDTYGLISDGLPSIVRDLIGAWGLPTDVRSTGFLKKGDHYEYWAIQPEVKEALRYVKDLYAEGLIQPFTLSAATNVQVRPKFMEGRVGALFDNANFEELLKKQELLRLNFPEAKLIELSAPAGPEGKRGYSAGAGFWGYTVITDKAANPRAAARLLDFLLSDEGNRLTLYGVPGVHYTEENGKVVLNLEERKKDIGFGPVHPEAPHELNWGLASWSRMTEGDYVRFRETVTPGFADTVKDNLARINRYLIEPASYSLATSKWVSFKSNSDELTAEYFSKIIMGEMDVDAGFDRFVKKWMESGGAEAMQEMSDAMADAHG